MKKALSLLLVALLIISAMPTFVFAESVTNDFYNAENWQELNASTSNPISWGATTIGSATKDGETVDVIKVNAYVSFCHAIKLAVEANQEYVLSFDYQSPVFGTFGAKTAAIESLGVAPLKDGALAGRSHTTADPAAIYTMTPLYSWAGSATAEDRVNDTTANLALNEPSAEEWYSVSFDFNSGDNTELQFYIKNLSSTTADYISLANFELRKKTKDELETEKLNDPSNWTVLRSAGTVIDWMLPAATTATKNDETVNGFTMAGNGSGIYATAIAVEKNHIYSLSFDYYSETLGTVGTKTSLFNSFGVAKTNNGEVTYRTHSTTSPESVYTVHANYSWAGPYDAEDKVLDSSVKASVSEASADNWYSAGMTFAAGDNEALEFYVHPATLTGNARFTVANIVLKDLGEAPEDISCKELNNVDNWTVLRSAGTVIDWMVPTATTATKNGQTVDAIALKGNNAGSYVSSFSTAKNRTYRLTFDYYAETIGTLSTYSAVIASLGVAPLKDGEVVYRTHATTDPAGIFTIHASSSWVGSYAAEDKVIDNTFNLQVNSASEDNWYQVSFDFNSGDNEALEIYLNPVSINNAVFKVANFTLEDMGTFYSAENMSADETLYNTYGATPYDADSKGFKLSYIGSGIEFAVENSKEVSVGIKLPSFSSYKKYSADSEAVYNFHTLRLKLWIDGVAQDDIIVNQKHIIAKNITVAQGLSDGKHTIKLVRATEAAIGKELALTGVLSKGTLATVEKADKPYIEVYGDSVSSGYGNIASGSYTNFNNDPSNYVYVKDGYAVDASTEGAVKTINTSEFNFEDGTKTYAYMAAENIGADIGVFSKSGLGITVYGGKAEETTETMSKWYPNLPVNPNADYVIINHITNDSKYYNSAAGLTKEGLADAYADFIATVRADHANAKIIVVYGMMPLTSANEDYYLTGEEVVLNAVAKAKQNDSNVYALMLPAGKDGGAGHPSEAQHLAASELLTQFINGLDTVATSNYAGVRAKTENREQGIRVKNTVSRDAIDSKNIVTYGAVAIRKANLERGAALTLNTEKAVTGIAYNTSETNGYSLVTTPILREQTENENIFSAVLINIATKYFDDKYSVRSFAIDADGNVYYGEVTEVSIFDVVYSILESGTDADKATANALVNQAISADATDSAGDITTYAEWCAANSYTDKSAVANN